MTRVLLLVSCYLLLSIDYQPVKRSEHSTVRVGDYLYMWGGLQPDLPRVHNNEKKKSMCSVMEVCHLRTGKWEQKPTTHWVLLAMQLLLLEGKYFILEDGVVMITVVIIVYTGKHDSY